MNRRSASEEHRKRDTIAWKIYAVARSAGCWVLLTIFTLIVGLSHIPSSLVAPEGRVPRWLEMAYMWAILRASNVKLTADGLEHVEPGRSYIVMANHRSMYDIPVVHYLLGRGRDLRWIGKQEVLRVPVFGWAYRVSRHVAIDRENRAGAIETLKRAADESRAGVSFVIMPEGTRRLVSFTSEAFSPKIARRNSVRPDPTRPAIPTISPARTSRSRSTRSPSCAWSTSATRH